ncbi:MAG: 30S ribosomal protein S16 [Fimbriimonadaceae bacterium]|nr:30S ribosomal protein S16 [Fimbriimonadaceae bacterium]
MGNKHRPFYRIVVSKSTAGRDGKFIEVLGTYNSLSKPSTVEMNQERALHWLMNGAQPTETVAYLLQREGVLETFFAERPKAKLGYAFLYKASTVAAKATAPTAVAEPAAAPAAEEVVSEQVEEATAEPEADAPAAEDAAPAEEATGEATEEVKE